MFFLLVDGYKVDGSADGERLEAVLECDR